MWLVRTSTISHALFMALVCCYILSFLFSSAHNAIFDTNVFKSELCRGEHTAFLDHFETLGVICTMNKTRALISARGKTNRIKNPSLKANYL